MGPDFVSSAFVFTSKDSLPQRFLWGLAYVGPDVIVGDGGYARFLEANPVIRPGGDGAYVVINGDSEGFQIGADYGGYAHIYYYAAEDGWAFSNSFYQLAEQLADRGTRLTPYLPGAAGMHIGRAIGQQPLTLRTPIAEIRLLARTECLEVQGRGASSRLIRRPVAEVDGQTSQTLPYAEGLGAYVNTWVSRYITILQSGAHLTCDITGGLDSRTNLALLLRAGDLLGRDTLANVHYNSNPGLKGDRFVADRIAQHFGLEIGAQATKDYQRPMQAAAYQTWKDYCQHSYWPIYIPTVARSDRHFWTGGAGGESHRWITVIGIAPKIHDLVDRYRPAFRMSSQFDGLRADLDDCIRKLGADDPTLRNSIVIHFRNFRERFHHGRRNQLMNAMSPLAGRQLSEVSRDISEEYRKTQRVYADIIFSTAPELLGFAFEKGYETFAGKSPDRLLDVSTAGGEIRYDGVVYDAGEAEPTGNFKGVLALQQLKEDFDQSVEAALDSGMVYDVEVAVARRLLERDLAAGQFGNRADLKPAATTLLAASVARWTG